MIRPRVVLYYDQLITNLAQSYKNKIKFSTRIKFFYKDKSFLEILLANRVVFKALSSKKIQIFLLLIINLSKYAALAELEKANEIL
jgi:hypothetical protein